VTSCLIVVDGRCISKCFEKFESQQSGLYNVMQHIQDACFIGAGVLFFLVTIKILLYMNIYKLFHALVLGNELQ